MMGAFLLYGEGYNALIHFRQMQIEGFFPDECTFVCALSACIKEKSLDDGKQIHSLAWSRGANANIRVGTSLLEMYRKCGGISDVDKMFGNVLERDAFTWSILISAHVQYSHSNLALPLFQQLLEESVFPDEVIFASTLASCSGEEVLNEGKRLHAIIIGSKCELDATIVTAVITMYGRCGSTTCACDMFKELPKRDVITWNSMITVYVKQGLSTDALQLYEEMIHEGIIPDEATFVSLLDACSNPTLLPEGKKLHDDLKVRGFDSHILVGTSLMNMYSRCDSWQQARGVFDNMTKRDVVSWNVMIDCCAQHQQCTDALQLFKDMQSDGVFPNIVTFLNVVQACSDDTGVSDGNYIHDLIVINSLESDIVIATALVTMYGKCGCLGDAWKLFSMIRDKNMVSWNTMIAGYVHEGYMETALGLFEQMKLEGAVPNQVTFISLFSLHETGLASIIAKRMHSCLRSIGLDQNVPIANALVSMYGKCCNVDNAWAVFEGIGEKDVVSWTAIMSVLLQQSRYNDCNFLFEQMQQQGIKPDKSSFVIMSAAFADSQMVSDGKLLHAYAANEELDLNIDIANALINMYGKMCNLDDALATFYRMHIRNKQTFVNMLVPCANLVAVSDGKRVHCLLVADSIPLERLVGNNLINLYGKCGCVHDAQWVFQRMDGRDEVSWSVMIITYAQHGQGKDALRLFDQMHHVKVLPNEVTFLGVLSACNHTGLAEDGCYHLVSMSRDYGLMPSEDHYNCIVDLLSRSGRLEEAEDIIFKMPWESRGVSWMTLLGACVCRADVVRGERAARNLFELDPKNPLPYVMLHNTFATADWQKNTVSVQPNNGPPIKLD